jgi:hypothetical protein
MAFIGSGPIGNVVQAEGVAVEIERADGSAVGTLLTLRDRPRFMFLPEGLYRMRFSHPTMNVRPIDTLQRFMWRGLSTDEQDTIEVPVVAGHLVFGAMIAFCNAPTLGDRPADLATCTFMPGDAGMN